MVLTSSSGGLLLAAREPLIAPAESFGRINGPIELQQDEKVYASCIYTTPALPFFFLIRAQPSSQDMLADVICIGSQYGPL